MASALRHARLEATFFFFTLLLFFLHFSILIGMAFGAYIKKRAVFGFHRKNHEQKGVFLILRFFIIPGGSKGLPYGITHRSGTRLDE